MSVEWIGDFEQRFQDAWSSDQADHPLVLMSEDIEYRDDAWPKTMHGHADVREALDAAWKAFPDMTFDMIEWPAVGDPYPPTAGTQPEIGSTA